MKFAFPLVLLASWALGALGTYTCPTASPLPSFNCPKLPPPGPALNVNQLKFGNIGVTMALGDSMTAGFGIKDLPEEYRGWVYSTGGEPDAHGLVSLFQNYNPNITGVTYNTTVPLTPFCSGLNCAVSGAVVGDIPGQIKELKAHLVAKYTAHVNDWKMLTLFIGANDACSCTRSGSQPDQFETKLRTALTYIHGNFSKTFVNVMTLFNISGVWDAAQSTVKCKEEVPLLHECSCLYTNATRREQMDVLSVKYNEATFKVAAEFQALQDPHFTVVVQPGVDSVRFASWPKPENYLSDVDCFHPSLCAHQGFALALWNNMNTPPAQKSHTFDPSNFPDYICPTAKSYLQ